MSERLDLTVLQIVAARGRDGQQAGGEPRSFIGDASRFPIVELGFQLVPWQPLLDKRIGHHITGLQREDGGIEWTPGRNRGLNL